MEIKKETMEKIYKFIEQMSCIHHEHEGVHIVGCEACQAGDILKELKQYPQLLSNKKEEKCYK